mgnify:FL=1
MGIKTPRLARLLSISMFATLALSRLRVLSTQPCSLRLFLLHMRPTGQLELALLLLGFGFVRANVPSMGHSSKKLLFGFLIR